VSWPLVAVVPTPFLLLDLAFVAGNLDAEDDKGLGHRHDEFVQEVWRRMTARIDCLSAIGIIRITCEVDGPG
jgi:hypothetical protein